MDTHGEPLVLLNKDGTGPNSRGGNLLFPPDVMNSVCGFPELDSFSNGHGALVWFSGVCLQDMLSVQSPELGLQDASSFPIADKAESQNFYQVFLPHST